MKTLIILLLINFAVGIPADQDPDLVYLPEEHINAKPIEEHPDFKRATANIFLDNPKSNNRGGKIYNGQLAALGQFPYQAFLVMYDSTVTTPSWYYCGGSFIKYNFVLTVSSLIDLIFSYTKN